MVVVVVEVFPVGGGSGCGVSVLVSWFSSSCS